MVDSVIVLTGQTIAYTLYCLVMILLVGWFSLKVTGKGSGAAVKPAIFYTFVGFLTVLGVSLHIITYNTIPWAKMDLKRSEIKPDKTFEITVRNHQFIMPSEKLVINVNDKVLSMSDQKILLTASAFSEAITACCSRCRWFQVIKMTFYGISTAREYIQSALQNTQDLKAHS
jgi:hypothetical protein